MSTIIIRPEDIPPDEPRPSSTGTPIVITHADIEGAPVWKRFLARLWARVGSWLGQTKTPERPASTVTSTPVVLSIPLTEPIQEPIAVVTPIPEAESVARCPYCLRSLEEGETRICKSCKTPHHKECWDANGGCTTLGCKESPVRR